MLIQCRSKLRCVLYLFATRQDLRVHRFDLVLKETLVLLGLQELVRADLKGVDCRVFVRLSLLFLSLQLGNVHVGHCTDRFCLVFQLLLEFL